MVLTLIVMEWTDFGIKLTILYLAQNEIFLTGKFLPFEPLLIVVLLHLHGSIRFKVAAIKLS